MYIILRIGLNPHVSYMSPGIHHKNARSWETLVLITLKVGLLSTVGKIPQTKINLTVSKKIILLLIVQLMKYYCMEIKNKC